MSNQPVWYGQLAWSDAVAVANAVSSRIPATSGCYVFTDYAGPLMPGNALYVGKAINLRTRLSGYLAPYMKVKPTKHKGRAFIFECRHEHGDARLFVRWTEYGDPRSLEGSLIGYLMPMMNDRFEPEMLDDEESLDPAFV